MYDWCSLFLLPGDLRILISSRFLHWQWGTDHRHWDEEHQPWWKVWCHFSLQFLRASRARHAQRDIPWSTLLMQTEPQLLRGCVGDVHLPPVSPWQFGPPVTLIWVQTCLQSLLVSCFYVTFYSNQFQLVLQSEQLLKYRMWVWFTFLATLEEGQGAFLPFAVKTKWKGSPVSGLLFL